MRLCLLSLMWTRSNRSLARARRRGAFSSAYAPRSPVHAALLSLPLAISSLFVALASDCVLCMRVEKKCYRARREIDIYTEREREDGYAAACYSRVSGVYIFKKRAVCRACV